MRLRTLAILISMTTGAGAWAETPAPAAEPASAAAAWDDSHMRSRYQETPRAKRPLITGETGYGALASGSAAASSAVAEGIEFTSQRQWTQGNLSTSTPASQASGPTPQSREPGSVHRQGRSGGRDSQLRRGSVHSGSRRH
jgi:hypothetical protein